jgi:uncharacterized protein (TIGR02145 family)
MRNLIPILLAVVVLSSGCDPDGYSCNSEGCYAENNAQYLTLEDCLSVCDEVDPNPVSCGVFFHEGYNYSTVLIGEQCWFSENCRYLPEVSPSSVDSDTDPYYYVHGYEGTDVEEAKATANYETYGVLYNWRAVLTDEICPSGWHVPSDEEWQTMLMSLGMSEAEVSSGELIIGTDEGYQMKSTSGWNDGGNGSNSSGFNGLPGGSREFVGFFHLENEGKWWSSSESNSLSWYYRLWAPSDRVARFLTNRNYGFSARCVRD